ncbi:hypothetical protein EJD97_021782, partial [Solanum chilense]
MEEIIFTNIYHGGILCEIFFPTYVENCVPALRYVIKEHFSIVELLILENWGMQLLGAFIGVDVKICEEGEVVEGEAIEGEVVNICGEGVDVNIGKQSEVAEG